MRRLLGAAAGLFLCQPAGTAWACAVCFGDPDSPLTRAVGPAVLVLLGFTAVVLGGIAAVSWAWVRRGTRPER